MPRTSSSSSSLSSISSGSVLCTSGSFSFHSRRVKKATTPASVRKLVMTTTIAAQTCLSSGGRGKMSPNLTIPIAVRTVVPSPPSVFAAVSARERIFSAASRKFAPIAAYCSATGFFSAGASAATPSLRVACGGCEGVLDLRAQARCLRADVHHLLSQQHKLTTAELALVPGLVQIAGALQMADRVQQLTDRVVDLVEHRPRHRRDSKTSRNKSHVLGLLAGKAGSL